MSARDATFRALSAALAMMLAATAGAADAPKPRYGRDRLRPDYVPPSSDGRPAPPPAPPPVVDTPPPVSNNGQGTSDAELGRGFVGAVSHRLELLQAMEGLVPRGVPVAALSAPPPSQPKIVRFYEHLETLHGAELIEALNQLGRHIMVNHPIGSPVDELREAYADLVHFVSGRTGVSVTHIYRVMDLESGGGKYWAQNPSGASGCVQMMPIALAELQRLLPDEFSGVRFRDIQANPALNIYAGMRYAALKGQNWDHYSGGANGYAHYVLTGQKL